MLTSKANIFFLTYIFLCFSLHAQNDLETYILKHGKEFNLNINDPLPVNYFSNDLNKYQVFFSGEIHGIPSNPIVKFKLFEYFYKNANVRNLIIESGISSAFMAQRYLETGDANYLCSCWTNEMSFWEALRSFNLGLMSDQKVRVIGIDFERNENFIKAMKEILPKGNPPQSIAKSIEHIHKIVKDSLIKDERIELTKLVKEQLDRYPKVFEDYIGKNYGVFSKIINNPVSYTPSTKRDKQAYKHFVSLIDKEIKGNFYGQYGISHVNLTFGNIADLLNSQKDSPFQGKVFTLIPHYFNCASIRNFDLIENDAGYGILGQSRIKDRECIAIKKHLETDATIVQIKSLQNYKKLKKGTQAMILIKDQKAKQKKDQESKML